MRDFSKKTAYKVQHLPDAEKKQYLVEKDRLELMALIEDQADRASDKKDLTREEYYKTLSQKKVKELERVRVLHFVHRGRLKGGRDKIQEDAIALTQFERIVIKFGSISNLYKCLNTHRPGSVALTTIYNWRLGAGGKGIVPNKYAKALRSAARLEGIYLSDEDFNPSTMVLRHK